MKKLFTGKKKWFAAVAAVLCMSMMLCTSAFAGSTSSSYEGGTVTAYNSCNFVTCKISATTSYTGTMRAKTVYISAFFDGKWHTTSTAGGPASSISTSLSFPSTAYDVVGNKMYSVHTVSSTKGQAKWNTTLNVY